jgi:hypothetical protein
MIRLKKKSLDGHSAEKMVRVDWTSGTDGSAHTVTDGGRLRTECGAVLAIESDSFVSLRDQPK